MSDATIAKCLFTEGDVICLKCGAVTWWESPEAKLSRCRWLHPHMISYILLIFRSGLLKESQLHSSVQAWKWFVMAIAMIMSGSITVTS